MTGERRSDSWRIADHSPPPPVPFLHRSRPPFFILPPSGCCPAENPTSTASPFSQEVPHPSFSSSSLLPPPSLRLPSPSSPLLPPFLLRRALRGVSTGMFLGLLLGLGTSLLIFVLGEPLLRLFGATSEMIGPALAYSYIRALGQPAMVAILVCQGCSLGQQDAQTPFKVAIGAGLGEQMRSFHASPFLSHLSYSHRSRPSSPSSTHQPPPSTLFFPRLINHAPHMSQSTASSISSSFLPWASPGPP